MPSILFRYEPNRLYAGSGEFHCPTCGTMRGYRRTEVRRTAAVLGARLPWGRYGEYVECTACVSTFRPQVLAYSGGTGTEEVVAEYQRALKRILALMVMVDGVVRDREISIVRRIFEDVTGVSLRREDVIEEVEDVGREPTSVARYLSRASGYLNEYGKEQILRGAILVSRADGSFDPRESEMVRRIGAVLHVPLPTVETLIRTVSA